MQKYRPKIWVKQVSQKSKAPPGLHGMLPTSAQTRAQLGGNPWAAPQEESLSAFDGITVGDLEQSKASSVTFPETSFITVTAYQNQQVTK